MGVIVERLGQIQLAQKLVTSARFAPWVLGVHGQQHALQRAEVVVSTVLEIQAIVEKTMPSLSTSSVRRRAATQEKRAPCYHHLLC